MPTTTGKPRVGETLYTRDGQAIGVVTRRSASRSKPYTIWYLRTNAKYETRVPDFQYWSKMYGWYTA